MSTTPSPALETVPQDLRVIMRWILWRYQCRGGKLTKVPLSPRTGEAVSVRDREHWMSFDEACEAFSRGVGGADGLGLVFDGSDRLVGVDLDNCINEAGELSAEAAGILGELSTYAEISPSGRGVKAFLLGDLPEGSRCKQSRIAGMSGLEIYRDGRYFTVTGNRLEAYPAEVMDRADELLSLHRRVFPGESSPFEAPARRNGGPLDDEQVIEHARGAKNGAKFIRLFEHGDLSGHGNDDSVADLALCGLLAYWTQDPAQLDRLFRRSALMREKWDARRGATTYGAMTIAKALSGGGRRGAGQAAGPDGRADERVLVPLLDEVQIIVEHAEVSDGVARLTLGLEVDGEVIDGSVMLTTTKRRKQEAADEIMELLAGVRPDWMPTEAGRTAVKSTIARLAGLTRARELERRVRARRTSGDIAAREQAFVIAKRFLQERFDPRFRLRQRTSNAVWSERDGRVYLQRELVDLADRVLLEELAEGSAWAVPSGGRYAGTLAQLGALLRVVTTEILSELPEEWGATDLGPSSRAAAEFWRQLLAALLAPVFQTKSRDLQTEWLSVAEQARRCRDASLTPNWQRLIRSVPAWARAHVGPGAEVQLQIAIRHELVDGVVHGHSMAAASDARSFTVLARRYGAADPETPAVTRGPEKAERVLVLSREFTNKLLGCLDPGE